MMKKMTRRWTRKQKIGRGSDQDCPSRCKSSKSSVQKVFRNCSRTLRSFHPDYHPKGWIIRVKDPSSEAFSDGREFEFGAHKLQLKKYYAGGVQVFLTDHSGPGPDQVTAVAIAKARPRSSSGWVTRNFEASTEG